MIDRARLSKLLGLLGSDHDGEVINAARAADRLVRASGLRWPDITMPALPAPPRGCGDDRFDAIGFCLSRPEALSAWEVRFLHSIDRQSYRLTPKQLGVLERIVKKVEG